VLGRTPNCLGSSLDSVQQPEVYWPEPVVEAQILSLKQDVRPVGTSLTLFRWARTIGLGAIRLERAVLTIEMEGE
jgi:hypothetical protein